MKGKIQGEVSMMSTLDEYARFAPLLLAATLTTLLNLAALLNLNIE